MSDILKEIEQLEESLLQVQQVRKSILGTKREDGKIYLEQLRRIIETNVRVKDILENKLQINLILKAEDISNIKAEDYYIVGYNDYGNIRFKYNKSCNRDTHLKRMYNSLYWLIISNKDLVYFSCNLGYYGFASDNIQNMMKEAIIPLCDYIIEKLEIKLKNNIRRLNMTTNKNLSFNGATIGNQFFMGDGNTTGNITLTNNENKLSEEATKIIKEGEKIIEDLKKIEATTKEQQEAKDDLITNIKDINGEIKKENIQKKTLRTNVRSIVGIVKDSILPLANLATTLIKFTEAVSSFHH